MLDAHFEMTLSIVMPVKCIPVEIKYLCEWMWESIFNLAQYNDILYLYMRTPHRPPVFDSKTAVTTTESYFFSILFDMKQCSDSLHRMFVLRSTNMHYTFRTYVILIFNYRYREIHPEKVAEVPKVAASKYWFSRSHYQPS